MRYNWSKLLSRDRKRKSGTKDTIRNEFDKDYDRIISSSPVRRLQHKTQVFPLQEDDIVRTRLTHSIEVSAIAKSLGLSIGEHLLCDGRIDARKDGFQNDKMKYELASLLSVTGIVHDLGNPPFGHYGEKIIREWFKNWFEKEEVRKISIPDAKKEIFCYLKGMPNL